jgi:hypothetical protein
MHRRSVLAAMAALTALPARAAAQPETVAEIPGPLLLEGIAHDGRRLYLGAVAGRKVLSLDRGGRLWTSPFPDLLGVFGLVSQGARLWAATADLSQPGRSELVELDPGRGRVIARHKPPPGNPAALFGDLAASPAGDVFVSDSKGGAILRLKRGGKALETLVPPGRLKSPQGMVVDGQSLVIADYATGLHRVDLATGASTPIDGMNIRGVDGLCAHRSGLIAIQNGASTPRVIRLAPGQPPAILYEGGVLIEPTLGTIVGDRLLLIGRSQWGEANDKGEVRPGAGPTRVMSLALPA